MCGGWSRIRGFSDSRGAQAIGSLALPVRPPQRAGCPEEVMVVAKGMVLVGPPGVKSVCHGVGCVCGGVGEVGTVLVRWCLSCQTKAS